MSDPESLDFSSLQLHIRSSSILGACDHSRVYSCLRVFVPSCCRPLIPSFSHSLILSFPHSLTPSLPHSLTPSFPHSLILSLLHSLTPSLPHKLLNPLFFFPFANQQGFVGFYHNVAIQALHNHLPVRIDADNAVAGFEGADAAFQHIPLRALGRLLVQRSPSAQVAPEGQLKSVYVYKYIGVG